MRNARGKRGVSLVVLDFSQNKALDDEQAVSFTRKAMKNRRISEVAVIDHAGVISRLHLEK
ncbi:hypothetical protein [Olsenella phocaeensis]|uniref:hypothetical protein n=1 Tax=Olsenella phocaeensis TaxID=1852385 RepID=UPI00101AE0E3|nr:hypothetical protein [Olsenella phocaeensis]